MSMVFDNLSQQVDEIEALRSIYGDDFCLDIRCGAVHEFDTEIDFEDLENVDGVIEALRRSIERDELVYQSDEAARNKLVRKYESIAISYDIALHLQLPENGCLLKVSDSDDPRRDDLQEDDDDSSISRSVPVAVVQYLPPLVLHISTRNVNYPSEDMPKFTLSAPWMDDKRMKKYSQQLLTI